MIFLRFLLLYYHKTGKISSLVLFRRRVYFNIEGGMDMEHFRLSPAAETGLAHCAEVLERYGLGLTAAERARLCGSWRQALRDTGRVELGESILPRLAMAFCDSPWVERETWIETLEQLAELFCREKERRETPDDVLLRRMRRLFDEARGSTELLAAIMEEAP